LKIAKQEEYMDGLTFIEYEGEDFKRSYDIIFKGLEESSLPIKPIKASGGYFI